MAIPSPANFTPTLSGYSGQNAFRFWCQKVLPLVYDDSLSYYELLNKMVIYLNNVIADVASVEGNVEALLTSYEQLQTYVNNWFNEAAPEVAYQALNRMAENGELDVLIQPFVETYVAENIDGVVAEQIDGAVAGQIDGAVGDQIGNTVAGQIDGVVGEQIGGTVGNQIGNVVANQIGGTVAGQIDDVVANQIGEAVTNPVTEWLDENVTPVGSAVVVDSSLSIAGAAADAKATGDRLIPLEKNVQNSLEGIYKSHKTEATNSYDLNNVWQVNDAAERVPKSLIIEFEPQQNGTPTPANPVNISGSTSPEYRIGKGNLFNGAKRAGASLDSGGNITANTGYQVTGYINISGINSIRIEYYKATAGGSVNRIAFYDKNYNFISLISPSNSSGNAWTTITETVPNGAEYMRFTCATISSNYLLISGDSFLKTIDLPEAAKPLYGGYVDVVNGKVVATWGVIEEYNGEQLSGEWKSTMDVYDPNSSPTNGAKVVYKLDEPIVYNITPTQVYLFSGKTFIQSNVSRPNTRAILCEYVINNIADGDTIKRLNGYGVKEVNDFTIDFNPYITDGKIAYGSGLTRAGSTEMKFPEEYNYFIAKPTPGYTINVHEIYGADRSAKTVASWNTSAITIKINHDSSYVVQACMRNPSENIIQPANNVYCTLFLYHDTPLEEFYPIYKEIKEPELDTIASELRAISSARQPQALGYGNGKLVICFPTYGFKLFDALTGENISNITIASGEPYGHMNDIAYRNGLWYIPYYNADGVSQDKCFVFDDTFTNPTEIPLLDENNEAFACWRFCYNKETDEFYAAAHNDYTFLVYNATDMSYARKITLDCSTTITGSTKTYMQGCETDGKYLYCTNTANNFSYSFVSVFEVATGKLVGTIKSPISPSELEGWAYDWDHKMWYQMFYDKPDSSHRGFQLQRMNPYSQPKFLGYVRKLIEALN